MAPTAYAGALFHLTPLNSPALKALDHPDNRHFVSCSRNGKSGFEIGFHVSKVPGKVMARLGRNTDLILPNRKISATHVAFEIHPHTLVVLLSVRSKLMSTVTVTPAKCEHIEPRGTSVETSSLSVASIRSRSTPEKPTSVKVREGDCVLAYACPYKITILDYEFLLVWRHDDPKSLRQQAARDYQRAIEQQDKFRSRDLPTECDLELHTWYNTRLHSLQKLGVREDVDVPRMRIGQGTFGAVYQAIDLQTGYPFVIKVLKLEAYGSIEQARACAYREIKALERLKHENIIELLGGAKWDTLRPEIYMPLRSGTLRSLVNMPDRPCSVGDLCQTALVQCLAALDYLALHNVCHRDVKPENILYCDAKRNDSYTFQLADFGLANHEHLAQTKCGTVVYEAPELHPEYGRYEQSSKMDVWSLFATLIAIRPDVEFPPRSNRYADVLAAVLIAAENWPELASMARMKPAERASAGQLLVMLHQEQRLSTPRHKISPLSHFVTGPVSTHVEPAVELHAQTVRAELAPPIKFPRPRHRQRARKSKGKSSLASIPEEDPRKLPAVLRPQRVGIRKSSLRPRRNRGQIRRQAPAAESSSGD